MASKLSAQLTSDPLSQKGIMADFTHASRLFVDSDLKLSPKVKFLYHVVFDINTNALVSAGFKFKNQTVLNMLVKKADMPKFAIQTDTLNQYNRKKVVQKRIEYDPVNITFHDDSYGVTRSLWENYYNYYFADHQASSIPGAYAPRNSTRSGAFIIAPYGMDSGATLPFFNKITIYQMSRGDWSSCELINPIISSWNHDTMDYSQNAPVENTMTLKYEAVKYDSGSVKSGNPPGFASEHYDVIRSPNVLSKGSNSSSQFQGTTTSYAAPVQPVSQVDPSQFSTPKLNVAVDKIETAQTIGGVAGAVFPGIK